MKMPTPDAAVIQRRGEIVEALRRIVPGEGVIVSEAERRAYESDGLTAYHQLPMVVVLPAAVEQVAAVLRYCREIGIKVVPRGAGTSLSGGALPLADGVLLGMAKFNRILEIDYDNRCVIAQPGVTNLAITKAVEHAGFYYAPDPSSQIACTIGGNVAENSGGVHCLKYGLTTNNILGIEMVLMDGELIRLGGKHLDAEGYDLLGVMTGSEGLLGVVTEVIVRILPKPTTARAVLIGFATTEDANPRSPVRETTLTRLPRLAATAFPFGHKGPTRSREGPTVESLSLQSRVSSRAEWFGSGWGRGQQQAGPFGLRSASV